MKVKVGARPGRMKAVPPLFRAMVGVPVTLTASLKVTVIGISVPDG